MAGSGGISINPKNHDGTDPGSVAEDVEIGVKGNRQGFPYVDIGHPYAFHTLTTTNTVGSAVQMVTASGAGLSYYITDVVLSSNTAGAVTVLENTGAAINRLTVQFGPNGGVCAKTFRQPIKCSANVDLGYTIAQTVTSIAISGYLAP